MNWQYQGTDFDPALIESNWGIIYEITYANGKVYRGKKKFEGNWNSYVGSGAIIKKYIKKHSRKWIRETSNREILEICLTHDIAKERERFYIAELKASGRDHWNLADGGQGSNGFKHSVETRAKMSASHKGKIRSSEHRQCNGESIKKLKGERLNQFLRLWSERDYTQQQIADFFGIHIRHAHKIVKRSSFCK